MKINNAIRQAINREADIGEFLLENFSKKLKEFEKKYRLKTSSFLKLFEKGELSDKQDFFEWFAVCQGKKHWEEKLSALKAA